MSQINRSELVAAHTHLCLPQGSSVLFNFSQTALQHASLVMMDKLPWSVVCQSDSVPARLHPWCSCCTLERCMNSVMEALHTFAGNTAPPPACNSSSPLLLCPHGPRLKLCLSVNVCITCCLSCWSVMKSVAGCCTSSQVKHWLSHWSQYTNAGIYPWQRHLCH